MDRQTKILLSILGAITAIIVIVRYFELNSDHLQKTWAGVVNAVKGILPSSRRHTVSPIYLIPSSSATVQALFGKPMQILKVNEDDRAEPSIYYVYWIQQKKAMTFSLLSVKCLELTPNINSVQWTLRTVRRTYTIPELGKILDVSPTITEIEKLWGISPQKITGFNGKKIVKFLYLLSADKPLAKDPLNWALLLCIEDDHVQYWGIIGSQKLDLAKLDETYFGCASH